jgi:hypothetical protein
MGPVRVHLCRKSMMQVNIPIRTHHIALWRGYVTRVGAELRSTRWEIIVLRIFPFLAGLNCNIPRSRGITSGMACIGRHTRT